MGNDVSRTEDVFGRDAELDRIDRMLGAVVQGAGQVLLLEGEAGIGKSHLARAASRGAVGKGIQVAVGGADEFEQDRPGRVLAALSDHLGTPFTELVPGRGAEAAHDPGYAVVERFVDVVQDAAARAPVLLVVEDLHWADELSLRGLASLVRRIDILPVGVIGTLRPTPRPASLRRVLDLVDRGGASVVPVGELDDEATSDIAVALTGAPPASTLRRRLETAGGNPFFVAELVRSLQAAGALQVERGLVGVDESAIARLPEGLVQTLNRRMGLLSTPTFEVLRLASLLGGEFRLDELSAIAGRDSVEVATLLQEAVDAAIVDGAGTRLAFRHDLIREAVYLGLAPAMRAELHLAAARSLAAAGAPTASVARQYALGAHPGDATAAEWLRRAADDAVRLDTAAAVSLLERALQLAPSEWPPRAVVESDLVEQLAWSGRAEDAQALAVSLLDRSLSPEEELAARRAFGAVLSTVGDLAGAIEQFDAAATLPGVDGAEREILRCALAGMSVIAGTGTPEVAQAAARPHLDTNDPALACWARNTLAVAAVAEGSYDEQLEHARVACSLLERHYVPPLGFLIPQTWLPTAHYHLDDFEACAATATAARRQGERHGDVGLLMHALAMLTGLDVVTGGWEDARSTIDTGLALIEETGVKVHLVFLHAMAAEMALGQGDRAEAEEHVQAGEAAFASGSHHPFGLDVLLRGRAQLLEAAGDLASAAALLGTVWDQTANLHGLIDWHNLGPDVIRLSRSVGDDDRSVAVAERMEELAGRSSSQSARACALRGRGLSRDEPEALRQAIELFRATGRVLETAMTCEEVATLLVGSGRVEEAVELLEEAAARYGDMGAAGHLARVDARLRAVGIRHRRAPASKATHGWAALSPKEREVVGLVAEGLSNPKIAERLYISRRTVESHLSSVFRKLGLSNRTQLAAAAVERAADDESPAQHAS